MELYDQAIQMTAAYLAGYLSLTTYSNQIHEMLCNVWQDELEAAYTIVLGMVHELAMLDSDLIDEQTLKRNLLAYLP